MKKTMIPLLFVLSSVLCAKTIKSEITRLEIDQNVELPVWKQIQSNRSTANLILLVGGNGNPKFHHRGNSITTTSNNTLMRVRKKLIRKNFNLFIPGLPSDQKTLKAGHRSTARHLDELDTLVKYIRTLNDRPIFLVGISRGVESAIRLSLAKKTPVDGLILASPVTLPNKHGGNILDLNVRAIDHPTLVLTHKKDRCPVSPHAGAKTLYQLNDGDQEIRMKTFRKLPRRYRDNNPCRGMSAHGFAGSEKKFVRSIGRFVKRILKAKK